MTILIAAFMTGLAGSPHCVGMCGGFASLCARSLRESVAWHAGRLSTYAVLGAVAGYAGHLVPGPPWVALVLSAILMVYFAGVLAGVFPQVAVGGSRIARVGGALLARGDVPSRYGFGMVTGLLPCGMVYMAVAIAVASGSALMGAVVMVAFGLGTVPMLAFLSGVVHRLLARGIWVRRGMAALVLVMTLWSLGMRAGRLLE